ncbi:hypothetical protein TNCV_3578261 [Trichonephila clavipes]|nr:hypothetical protein TNCV_3578261 [Trichonephila clavipes]
MLEKVIENWTSRLDYIRASRGSHMPEIIFKIVVFNSWKPFSGTGSVEKNPGRSRLRTTMTREDRDWSIIVRHNRVVTASQLSRALYAVPETRV